MLLRPYQSRLVSRAVRALEKRGNTLCVAPTGAGKTIMLGSLAKEVGGKTLVLQHRQELVGQNMRKFRQINERATCSLFTADKKSFRGDATFAMVQSLCGHLDRIPKLDLVIADEAHHCAAPTWQAILERARELNPDVKIAGFTATPSRTDGKGLRKIFDNVCDKITLKELVELGFLVPPRAFVLKVDGVDEKLKALKNQSDFGDQAMVADVLNTAVVNGEVIRHWREKGQGRPTVVFAATVAHAEDVAKAFREAGIPAECVHGELPVRERNAILDRMTSGETKVITNCMVLTEGWDFPPVSCVVLLRKCSSKGPMIQMVGRGLRTVSPQDYPGVIKKDCIVLDFGMSLAVHGNIDADVDLDEHESDPEDAPTKDCPQCEAEVPAGVRICPFCGYVFPPPEEEATQVLEQVELSEVDILGRSPWRYVDLFGTGRCFLASGFEAWAGIFSKDDETWYAIGRKKKCRVNCVHVGERTQALAAADDFLRTWETETASMKFCRWLNDPCTDAQMAQLARFGYTPGLSKYEAGAHLSFQFGRKDIERIIGV
jgi:superfamily II DNA or RNA helicase